MPAWRVEHLRGDGGAFHDASPSPDDRSATFFAVDGATLVLGSSQRDDSVRSDVADERGITVVRRRSGGGGVLLLPDEFVWLDLVIPAGDPLWDDDIGRSMWWVGELWREALAAYEPSAVVHHGPLQRSRWSNDICFAGVGPGEVLSGGAKLVGVSQRRTRRFARFQSMVHLQWRPETVASLAAAEPPVEEIASLVTACVASAAAVTAALAAALSTR
jgi:lipoate-protein ligase A